MLTVVRAAAWIGAAAWVGLIVARGRFWDARADRLRPLGAEGSAAPDVAVVVPARNEADVLGRTLASLLRQRYAGTVRITVVDDRSDDGTGAVARATAEAHGGGDRVEVVAGRERPEGWTGKTWALRQGIAASRTRGTPELWWFSDADVEHDDTTLARLVETARAEDRDLVSQMVALHCATPMERLFIPAFVYFFRMLYPFAWVNDDNRRTAAAAGGCVLLSETMLGRIGGIERIKGEMIDDCALAAAVQSAGGRMWLGLATTSRSVRPYASFDEIWTMVARSAYTQLHHSPRLLAGTVAGMAVLYVAPPLATLAGVTARRWDVALPGALAWTLLSLAYAPTLRLYRVPRIAALALPLAGILYTAMTVDSAIRHARGSGGMWKGRTFARRQPERLEIPPSSS